MPPSQSSPRGRDDGGEPAVVLPTRGVVVFPGALKILTAGRPTSVRAVERHVHEGQPLLLVPQHDADQEDPLRARLAKVGVLGRALRVTALPDGTLRVLVEGLARVRVRGELEVVDGATVLRFDPLGSDVRDPLAAAALARALADRYAEYAQATGLVPEEHDGLAPTADEPEQLADQVFGTTDVPVAEQIAALAAGSVEQRLQRALDHLAVQLARHRITADVNAKVQRAMDDSQREYQIKEQIKALRAELGEVWGAEADADRFRARLDVAELPEEADAEIRREIERLRRIHTDSAEFTLLRTWIETALDLPWSKTSEDRSSIPRARRALDRDHHGLQKPKDRILEYLAVRRLAPESRGPILCFVGPPGVGKTSLGRSIADALGRTYARVALGGIRDETEIRGHRRTYVGALPGRILRALIRAGTRNPVLVLDELDKVGNDFRGDPASALLEVLDPEQNHAFVDHYLDLPFDLSQVLFLGTANVVDTVPAALLDRLEVVELTGYTEEDKIRIAKKHLLPKIAEAHGLTGGRKLKVETDALQRLVREWTREAGVRDLERQLAAAHRKVARRLVEEDLKIATLGADALPGLLGPPRFPPEEQEVSHDPGVVTGVAWTAAGGDVLYVEATRVPGKPGLKLTGSLGDVMKESAEAAASWLRANAERLGIPAERFDAELHLHVPAGAIPKDGPSAGVTMVTALASLLLGIPVRERLAMTGEITLRGKVLPVGGVKEKALAARRAGVTTFLLPGPNENDLVDIPAELRADLVFVRIERTDEVLHHALGLPLPAPPRRPAPAGPARAPRPPRPRRRPSA